MGQEDLALNASAVKAAKAIVMAFMWAVGLTIGVSTTRLAAGAIVDLSLLAYVLLLLASPSYRWFSLALALGGDMGSILRSVLALKASITTFVVIDIMIRSGHESLMVDPVAIIVVIEVLVYIARWISR